MHLKMDSIQKLQQLSEGEQLPSIKVTYNFYKNTIDRQIVEAFGIIFPADLHFQQWIVNALEYDFDSAEILNSVQPLVVVSLQKKDQKIVPVVEMHPEIEKIYQKEEAVQGELKMILDQLESQVNHSLKLFKPIHSIPTIEEQIVEMVFMREGDQWEFLTFNHSEIPTQEEDHLFKQNRRIETYKLLMDNQFNILMSILLSNSIESNSKQIMIRCITNGATLEMKEMFESEE